MGMKVTITSCSVVANFSFALAALVSIEQRRLIACDDAFVIRRGIIIGNPSRTSRIVTDD
jgi:hypothetical protein